MVSKHRPDYRRPMSSVVLFNKACMRTQAVAGLSIGRQMTPKEKKQTKKGGTSSVGPGPSCPAMILCDQAICDRNTGKFTLVGLFEAFLVQSIPGTTTQFNLYILFANIHAGKHIIYIRFLDPNLRSLVELRSETSVKSDEFIVPVSFNISPLPVSMEGEYTIEVTLNEKQINTRQFRVFKRIDEPRAIAEG